jgi:hypothetical protein
MPLSAYADLRRRLSSHDLQANTSYGRYRYRGASAIMLTSDEVAIASGGYVKLGRRILIYEE